VTGITVAGLPLAGENEIMQPLAAVVCIKGLDDQGNVCYWSRATEGLSTTEGQGMALGLLDDLRAAREQS
jgi:hypothetical protein